MAKLSYWNFPNRQTFFLRKYTFFILPEYYQ
jgi:hypothetical protein